MGGLFVYDFSLVVEEVDGCSCDFFGVFYVWYVLEDFVGVDFFFCFLGGLVGGVCFDVGGEDVDCDECVDVVFGHGLVP